MNFTLNFEWIEAVMLAAVRMTAFLLIAPPFSYNAIPPRIKGMLAIGLAFAVSPRVTTGYTSPDTAGFITALVLEIVVGGALGFLVMVVLAAVQIAGPLVVVLFLADAGLGLLTRVAPALNAFALGFPLKILLTLILGGIVFIALPGIVASLTGQAVGTITGVK
jgi:flagellar biosynthetic protein FliR